MSFELFTSFLSRHFTHRLRSIATIPKSTKKQPRTRLIVSGKVEYDIETGVGYDVAAGIAKISKEPTPRSNVRSGAVSSLRRC